MWDVAPRIIGIAVLGLLALLNLAQLPEVLDADPGRWLDYGQLGALMLTIVLWAIERRLSDRTRTTREAQQVDRFIDAIKSNTKALTEIRHGQAAGFSELREVLREG